jgi:hypothetical protein
LLVVIALLRLAGARGTMETVVTDTFFAEKFADRAETVRTQSSPSQIIEHHRAPTRAYGALHSNGPIQSMIIDRRVLLPDDVAIDVLYCGVCHSAIHMIRGVNSRFRWCRGTSSSVGYPPSAKRSPFLARRFCRGGLHGRQLLLLRQLQG